MEFITNDKNYKEKILIDLILHAQMKNNKSSETKKPDDLHHQAQQKECVPSTHNSKLTHTKLNAGSIYDK